MKIIALINNKGGVGKTTTSFNLGCAFAKLGKKVAMLDMDPQANLTSRFRDEVVQESKDLLTYIKSEIKLKSTDFSSTHIHDVSIIPNLKNFNDEVFNFKNDFEQYFAISDLLSNLKDEFDYIILDTPPTIGKIAQNAMIAADYLILPIRLDLDSVDGVEATLMYYNSLKKRQNIKAKILGILPTHVRQVGMNDFTFEDLRKRGIDNLIFKNQIPLAVAFDEARIAKQPIFVYERSKDHYLKLAEEIETYVK
jgi:chromosome partitioning protein